MNEAAISEWFTGVASPFFDLYPQCVMRQPVAGQAGRIDFIGFEKTGAFVGPLGFEVKDPQRWGTDGKFTAFSSAVAQCMDYQQMLIAQQFSDPEHTKFFGTRLRFTFLVPVDETWAWSLRSGESIYSRWAQGQLRLAGKYGVGSGFVEQHRGLMLTLGTETCFSADNGVSPLMVKHAVSGRVASSK